MKFRLCTGLAAIVCMTLVSCYPYREDSRHRNAAATPTPAEMKKKTQEEMKKNKAEEEMKRTQEREQAASEPKHEDPGTVTPPPDDRKPAEAKNDFPFANKVPGKDGFVFSPYNNKVVDVRDIPSGTLVQDPTYPASEKKYFRVP